MQTFRVFLRSGERVDVDADTYGRDGPDWVLYRAVDMAPGSETVRYPKEDVNAIALVKTEADRLLRDADLDAAISH